MYKRQVVDYHQVAAVGNGKVTFKEPLMHAVESQYGWTIQNYKCFENVGVEDVTFVGYAKPDFKHHGSWKDDGAYKPLDMVRLANSWVRRVAFHSVSEALTFTWCANCSAYDILITGNRGHSSIRSQASSRVFIGKVSDYSDGIYNDTRNAWAKSVGQYHACGVSKQSIGTVIWNLSLIHIYKNGKKSLQWNYSPNATLSLKRDLRFEPKIKGDRDNYLSAFIVWVYSEKPQPGKTITFQFLKNGKLCTSFPFGINFKGWRGAWVCYERDMQGKPEVAMDEVKIVAPDTKGTLFFDHLITAIKVDPRDVYKRQGGILHGSHVWLYIRRHLQVRRLQQVGQFVHAESQCAALRIRK